jgi:hypothetical protein
MGVINMQKKLFVIYGIVLMMLLTTLTISIVAEQNESQILGRTHIRAFGKFAVCEEDNGVYGKIIFGFIGLQPVFNLDIEICQDSIKWIVMSGFSINGVRTYRFLNCVITE